MPSSRQLCIVHVDRLEILCRSPVACASDTAGSSITERAFVTAVGKSTSGSAIPVSVPYAESAAERDRP